MKRTASCVLLGFMFTVLCATCVVFTPVAFVQMNTRASVLVGGLLSALGALYAIAAVVSFTWTVDGAREQMRVGLSDTLAVAGISVLLFLSTLPLALVGHFAGNPAAVALCAFVLGILPLTCYLMAERLRELGPQLASAERDSGLSQS